MQSQPQPNVGVARRFREALWTNDDPAALDEIIAPNCVVHGRAPFATGFSTGRIAIRQLIEFYQLTFSEIDMTVDRTVAEGDLVTLHWRARARHTGDLLGAPPTGLEVRTTGIDLLRIEDGQIVEGWMMWDEIGLLLQLFDARDRAGNDGPDLLSVVERWKGKGSARGF